jgi:hypothetical protein
MLLGDLYEMEKIEGSEIIAQNGMSGGFNRKSNDVVRIGTINGNLGEVGVSGLEMAVDRIAAISLYAAKVMPRMVRMNAGSGPEE